MYCSAQTMVSSYTLIRREKKLPVPGEVLVGLGDRVEPGDVIARGSRYTQVRIIDLARGLGVPDSQVDSYIRKQVGDPVKAGEVIAARKRLFGKACRAPVEGWITAIKRGRAILQAASVPVEVTACLRGRVIRLIEGYGAVIEAEAGIVQGVWGAGKEASGVLKLLVNAPDAPLAASAIDAGSQGCVLVGGAGVDKEALLRAAEVNARGVVVGAIHASLVGMGQELPFPLVITEGFGTIPMAEVIFDLFRATDGREVCISGLMSYHGEPVRPEVIILDALRGEAVQPTGASTLKPGMTVRMVREPYMGKIGKIKTLPATTRPVRSGTMARGVEIELHSGETIFVPVSNLELIR
jgi:hypothetical protein